MSSRDPVPEAYGSGASARAEQVLLSELAAQLEAVASSERELRRLLVQAHEQVGARDREIDRLLAALASERAEVERLIAEAAGAHGEIRRMRATRVWRAGALWWRMRDAVGRGG